jgi:hypothetical protein
VDKIKIKIMNQIKLESPSNKSITMSKVTVKEEPSRSQRRAARRLFDAILTNSLAEVRHMLNGSQENEGLAVDPNVKFDMIGSYIQFRNTGQKEIIDRVLLWKHDAGEPPRPLHIAVCNCYYHFANEDALKTSLEIIKTLLDHGADKSFQSNNIFLWDIEGKERVVLQQGTTALDLALLLKKATVAEHQQSVKHEVAMDRVMELLRGYKACTEVQVRVPTSLFSTLESLLFSDVLSDMNFVCSDGECIPAHKCILAASSDYFKAAFTGSWSENKHVTTQLEWRTSHSSKLLKAVLKFIYTGDSSDLLQSLRDVPLEVISVATEYGFSDLVKKLERELCSIISTGTIKAILLTSRLYELHELEKACYDFVKKQGASVLGNADFLALSQEDPLLWKKVVDKVSLKRKSEEENSQVLAGDTTVVTDGAIRPPPAKKLRIGKPSLLSRTCSLDSSNASIRS